jgi:hypothetical protein
MADIMNGTAGICCTSIKLTSKSTPSTMYKSLLRKIFTFTKGDTVNNKPVYRSGIIKNTLFLRSGQLTVNNFILRQLLHSQYILYLHSKAPVGSFLHSIWYSAWQQCWAHLWAGGHCLSNLCGQLDVLPPDKQGDSGGHHHEGHLQEE